MKRLIYGAASSDSPLEDSLDDAKADFEYIVDGLEKLSRMGYEKDALRIAEELSNAMIPIEESISDAILE